MHEVDLARDVGQVQRFFDRGVAAADHGHVLLLVEEAVAGRAGGNAAALELLLRLQPQVLRRGAGGDDQRVGGVVAVVRSEEHTSELQSLMRISYAVFCLKKKITITQHLE